MSLLNGKFELLDGTELTIENSIIRRINGLDVLGLRDIALSNKELTQIRSYDGDTIVITTDTRLFLDIDYFAHMVPPIRS